MPLGIARMNSLARSGGDLPDFFTSDNPRQNAFNATVGFGQMEFIGFDGATQKDALVATSIYTTNRPLFMYNQIVGSSSNLSSSSPNGSYTFGAYEIENVDNGGVYPLIASPSRGANYGSAAQSASTLYFTTAVRTGSATRIRNMTAAITNGPSGGVSFTRGTNHTTLNWESTNDTYDWAMDSTGTDTAVMFARSDNTGNHKTQLFSDTMSSTTPSTYTTTDSNTPYGDNTRYRVLGLADGGCDYRGVYMASGTEPFASFFSYNGTTRTTSDAGQISKTDDSDSVPLICRIGASKVVYGIYAPSTDKMYLRVASHSWGGSCATGTTTTGTEIEIDAQDGGQLIDAFEDDKFYVVQYSNSNSTVKIRTFTVDGTDISELGSGTQFNAYYQPSADVYKKNAATKIDYDSTHKFIMVAYQNNSVPAVRLFRLNT